MPRRLAQGKADRCRIRLDDWGSNEAKVPNVVSVFQVVPHLICINTARLQKSIHILCAIYLAKKAQYGAS